MDDHFDIGRVFEIGKFDITRLTCISFLCPLLNVIDTGIMVKAAALSSTLSHLVSNQ